MEATIEEPYCDSPSSSRSTTPTPSSRASTAKPLPSLPHASSSHPIDAYRDDPSDSEDEEPVIASPTPQRHHRTSDLTNHQPHIYFTPYTDAIPESDDDVPLAHLYPYPADAPPSYAAAVRQSFRDTLIQHIPHNSVSTEPDEELGADRAQADDVRFTVERVVAAIIVSMLLLIIAALLALVALGYFVKDSF
ncbi:hypothetical protein BU26DRAFT_525382 [Trematosphaeria pertusa]|uniref:Uncharacterized protein n=1 Tax=Trematosphaeria pertusa TaxID=390896 RepID=A0A6A6HT47_9PLEO|nr:uncharacterized protein BU26DRAFT_525382 [Trematosphaeria pertusa]KAF2241187.1 hypothetical protein BU26DRAFT_525382 [Trematosphaeria pertusa]